ncbi:hypothetical protein D3C73_1592110 [compost metagenome]
MANQLQAVRGRRQNFALRIGQHDRIKTVRLVFEPCGFRLKNIRIVEMARRDHTAVGKLLLHTFQKLFRTGRQFRRVHAILFKRIVDQ